MMVNKSICLHIADGRRTIQRERRIDSVIILQFFWRQNKGNNWFQCETFDKHLYISTLNILHFILSQVYTIFEDGNLSEIHYICFVERQKHKQMMNVNLCRSYKVYTHYRILKYSNRLSMKSRSIQSLWLTCQIDWFVYS